MDTFFSDKKRWSINDVAKLLVSHNALTAITMESATEFVRRMTPWRVTSDTVLFREGNKDAKFMIFILQGEAIVETSAEGHAEPTVMKLLGEGDLIGEMGIVDSGARSATVRAVSDMALAVMDQAAFRRMVQQDPALACGLMGVMLQTVSRHLRQSNRKLHTMTQINRSMHKELQLATEREEELLQRPDTAARPTPSVKAPLRTRRAGTATPSAAETLAPRLSLDEELRRKGLPPDVNVDLTAAVDIEAMPSLYGPGRSRFSNTYPIPS